MSRRWRVALLALPLAIAALAGLAWLALNAWLESSGGRRAIEQVLSGQIGYPVSLAGEFEVVLLPSPGVSGTALRVYDTANDAVLVAGGSYAVALALRPLLRRELHVDRLTLGEVRFGAEDAADAGFLIPEFEVTGFEPERPAAFRLDLGPFGEAAGDFTWRAAAGGVDLNLDWGGFLFPRLSLDVRAAYDAAGLWLEAIDARVDGQAVRGTGCYRFDDESGLQLDLNAGRLDLDALDLALPDTGAGPEGAGPPVRLRLSAEEIVRDGVTARGAVLNLGEDPDCRRPGG